MNILVVVFGEIVLELFFFLIYIIIMSIFNFTFLHTVFKNVMFKLNNEQSKWFWFGSNKMLLYLSNYIRYCVRSTLMDTCSAVLQRKVTFAFHCHSNISFIWSVLFWRHSLFLRLCDLICILLWTNKAVSSV